jgi:hypothetical protein
MKAYIYKKLLIATGKFYIGKHNGNNKWYKGSGTDWLKDIKIYKDIKTEILEYVDNISLLNEREKYWLEYFDAANNPLFYNKTNKSSGSSTEESKKLISLKMKNHPSITNNKERNKKISMSLINNKERNKKISNGLKNKPKSDIHKKNMSKPKPIGFNDKLKKEIIQMDVSGNIINIYSSLTEASIKTGFNLQAINNCVLGKTKSSFGYLWKYSK